MKTKGKRTRLRVTGPSLLTVCLLVMMGGDLRAEPYLAVQEGLHCSTCHSHPAGGGKRTVYGNAFAQTELAGQRIGNGDLWTGEVNQWLSIGADLRAGFVFDDTPNQEERSEFSINRGTVYVEAQLIPGRVSVYVDQQFAPDASQNREAYVRLNSQDKKWFALAGQFYLPYGLRLQDDTAFIRLATGVNFTNPDRGIQVGYESNKWSTIASLSNGSGGGREIDSGKLLSVVSSYVRPTWRAGVSAQFNDADTGDRTMFGVFGGVRTGSIAWLLEVDQIRDDVSSGGTVDAIATLLEANWQIKNSHNLKFSYDFLDPDENISENHQVRYSLIWEHSPVQFLQGRVGVRFYDGIPQVDAQNRDLFFLELHGFF
jgi:hypothetical protein